MCQGVTVRCSATSTLHVGRLCRAVWPGPSVSANGTEYVKYTAHCVCLSPCLTLLSDCNTTDSRLQGYAGHSETCCQIQNQILTPTLPNPNCNTVSNLVKTNGGCPIVIRTVPAGRFLPRLKRRKTCL